MSTSSRLSPILKNEEHVTVTCSYETIPEAVGAAPSLGDCARLSAAEVHKRLCASLTSVAVQYTTAKNLIADAKRRMQDGEAVGGCTTWTAYVDRYLRKPEESLPVVIRRLYRALDGEAVNPKYDGSEQRKANADANSESAVPEPSNLIVHVNDGKPYDVYIGRKFVRGGNNFPASIWGNHNRLNLPEYEAYVRSSPELLQQLPSLKGKVLGCWHTVADRRKGPVCHGDVLLKLIDEFPAADEAPVPNVPTDNKSIEDGTEDASVYYAQLAAEDQEIEAEQAADRKEFDRLKRLAKKAGRIIVPSKSYGYDLLSLTAAQVETAIQALTEKGKTK